MRTSIREGDFYAEGIAGRWSCLELTWQGGSPARLAVRTYYANNRPYEPAQLETRDLKRYIEYWS